MGLFFESILLDVATIFSIVAAFVYHYLSSTHSFWEKHNVPYLKPHLIFGNFKDIITFKKPQVYVFKEFYDYFKKSGHKFGGIFQLRTPVLFICCPEIAKDIFVKHFPYFHDRNFVHDEHFDPLSAHLVTLEGQKWKFLRSKLSPAFSTNKLKGMLTIITEIADEYMKTLGQSADKGEPVELRKSCSLFLMDVIGATAFGINVNAQKEESEFLHVGKMFFEPTKLERVYQILTNSFPWIYKTFKLRLVSKEVTDFFTGVVRDTMEHRRKNDIQKADFLHFLMKIKEEKGANLRELEEMKGVTDYNTSINEHSIELTEGVITGQAFEFFLAGYETSSSAISSCIHILADYPEIQNKMLKEVQEVLKQYGDFTYEAIQNLIYIEQVLDETLRTYPPVTLIIRKCTKTFNFPDTNVIIPEGCQIFIPIYAFHYDPELFPEPEKFDPERFSPEKRKKIVPYSFMPFGHGPRVCIGSRLAMMEMKLSLALLIKNFKITKCEKTKPYRINPKSFFMSPVDGLWVKFVRREKI